MLENAEGSGPRSAMLSNRYSVFSFFMEAKPAGTVPLHSGRRARIAQQCQHVCGSKFAASSRRSTDSPLT